MKLISKIGVAAFLVMTVSACHQETGAEISKRIESACREEYSTQGDQAVTECRMRQTIKAMDRIHADHERSVDSAVGH